MAEEREGVTKLKGNPFALVGPGKISFEPDYKMAMKVLKQIG